MMKFEILSPRRRRCVLGRDLGPAIPAADKALETGSEQVLIHLVAEKVREGLPEHFNEANEKRALRPMTLPPDVDLSRAYVTYIHYVERLYEAAEKPVAGHYEEEVHSPSPISRAFAGSQIADGAGLMQINAVGWLQQQ